ncbi:MAG: hypothetical protein JWN73_4195 [Betaproteobacteria bacterium]|nr:hypothetical protein [Betaproteobacteria bacterium]
MQRFSFLRHANSLKAKVAIGVALLFALLVVALTAFHLHQTRESMVSLLSRQQTTLVNRTAEEIDDKFRDRKEALRETAGGLASALEVNVAAAPLLLRDQRALGTMFDIAFLFSPTGEVMASLPDTPRLRAVNVAKREYFIRTVAGRKALISAPYLALASHRPFVMMTAPIFDSNGRLIAILGGAIDLLKPNFLGEIGSTPVGQTGYFYVLTRGPNPIVVSHPRKEMILGPAVSPEQNTSTAAAQAGFEGTAEGVNSRGVRALMSYKDLKEAEWLLAAVLPTDEAFAPIQRSQRKTLAVGALAALLVAGAVWILVRQAMRPLDALQANVRQRLEDPRGTVALPVTRQDEIGRLTLDFNRLMAAQESAEQSLAENEQRLRTITDNVPVLIGYVDETLRYRFVNQPFEEWFGMPREQMIGKTVEELLGSGENYAGLQERIDHAMQGYAVTAEREIVTQGRHRYVQTTYLPHYGAPGQVLGLYILVTDLTERKAAEDRLDYLAHHDPLTALVNRTAFDRQLTMGIRRAQRVRKPGALMYLDIDRFKSINDSHGHGIGDRLLREFSARLLAAVRKTDTVGRLGGDEFVILLEDLACAEDAIVVAQKIIDAMRQPFRFEELELQATTSVGIAICRPEDEGIDAAALLERADAALYEAKAAGRNTFKVLSRAAHDQETAQTAPAK